jgi:SWI/SNF-related matrix-associated actin-dependent regulator 1 of chromatin subfamily A
MQSEKAQRTKAALRLMKTASRIFALSGTLMNNRPINLWALLTGLKINKRSWYDFAVHFARGWVAPWGFDTSGASNLPELKALVAPHLLRRSKQSVFKNYTPPEFRLVTFDRPVNKRESQFDIAQLAELENPILSIEGLSEIVHETARKKLPDAIDFISGMLDEEPDMKLVVFAYHTDIIDELAAGLKLYRPVTVKGATSPEMREARRNIFMTKPQCRLFIGNIICCAEAIDLSIADTCVFVETTWVPSLLEQAAARVENLGKDDSATLAYLLTIETSLDHHILKRVLQKLSTIKKVIPNESKPIELGRATRATRRA